jgi:hypothetical protein
MVIYAENSGVKTELELNLANNYAKICTHSGGFILIKVANDSSINPPPSTTEIKHQEE